MNEVPDSNRAERLSSLLAMANVHNLPQGAFMGEVDRQDDELLRAMLSGMGEPTEFGMAARRDAVVSLLQARSANRLVTTMERPNAASDRLVKVGVLLAGVQAIAAALVIFEHC